MSMEPTAEKDAGREGRPQGGMKSEMGRAAYWRMNYESAIQALADLIAENTENVEALTELRSLTADLREQERKFNALRTRENDTHVNGQATGMDTVLRVVETVLGRVTSPAVGRDEAGGRA